jgi:hypothetical protein
MAGGTLNLASNQGTGDDILSINPQITFFKKVYKRHTNFGLETRQVSTSTNSSVNFGESVTYTIDKTGTLINNMYIEFTLPPTVKSDGKVNEKYISGNEVAGNPTFDTTFNGGGFVSNWDKYCYYVNAVGYAILNEVTLEIDGNKIDKHNGLWYDIWNELTDPMRKEWSLVGKRDDTEPGKFAQQKKSRYYVPLKFYFNRNPGLSFPIFLIDDNKVKVSISLNNMRQLVKCDVPIAGEALIFDNTVKITDFKFFTNYVFLDSAEENRIRNNLPNEYLIETVDMKTNIKESELSKMILNNPVKEIIWVVRNTTRLASGSETIIPKKSETTSLNPNDVFNYSLSNENIHLGYGSFDTFKTVKFTISNQDRIQETDATYFRTLQPYYHHSNVPGGINNNETHKYIYSYSFAITPEEYQPSGSYNFTKSDDYLKITFKGLGNPDADANNFTDYRVDLFAFHYKFLSVNEGGIIYKDVPYSSSIQTETIADSPAMKGVEASIVESIVKKKCRERTDEAIVEEEKRLIAIEEEVRRRYSSKKPDVHRHQNFSKKKWSGLQGQLKE